MNYNKTIKGDIKDNEGNDVCYKNTNIEKKNYKLLQSTTYWVTTLQKQNKSIFKKLIKLINNWTK